MYFEPPRENNKNMRRKNAIKKRKERKHRRGRRLKETRIVFV